MILLVRNLLLLLSRLEVNAQISKDRRILERYLDLKELLLDYFNQFSEEVLRYDGEFNITTSWFTKIKTGCSSQYHCHKNSFYSGVLYFGDYSNDNGGAIKFNNPNRAILRLSNCT